MRVTRLEPSHYLNMPWKNGLGMTTEIARDPEKGDFDWRVSIARVATDGDFSTFPGCDRIILTLEGVGMRLTHHDTGTEASIGLLEPWTFSGDVATSCVLMDGAIRDFNVISRRDAFTPAVSVLRLATPRTIELAATTTLFYCVEGEVVVEATRPILLSPEQTLVLESASGGVESVSIRPSGLKSTLIQVDLRARAAGNI